MTDRARVMEVLQRILDTVEPEALLERDEDPHLPAVLQLDIEELLADLQAEAEAAKTAWCRMCEGKGTLTLNQTTSDGEKFQNHVPCVDCNGTGVVLEAEAGGEAVVANNATTETRTIENVLMDYFMERFEQELGNAGCNDIPRAISKEFPDEKWAELNRRFSAFNKDSEDYGSDRLPDYCYLALLRHELLAAPSAPEGDSNE